MLTRTHQQKEYSQQHHCVETGGKKTNELDDLVDLEPTLVIHGGDKSAARGGFSEQEGP